MFKKIEYIATQGGPITDEVTHAIFSSLRPGWCVEGRDTFLQKYSWHLTHVIFFADFLSHSDL